MLQDCFKHNINMEYQKITNLLGNISDKVLKFIGKKWIEVHDQSANADNRRKSSKQTRLKTSMLQSDLCNYWGAYIVVKGIIIVRGADNDTYGKKVAFKNNAPFINCISEINKALIDNRGDLDIVMLMHNLLGYRKSYSKTSGSL